MNWLQKLNPNYVPSSIDPEDVFTLFRERILQYVLLGSMVVGVLLIALLVPGNVASGDWFTAVMYSIGFILVVLSALFRNISFSLRASIFLAIVYGLALTDLLRSGMSGDGRLIMLVFILFFTILAPDRYFLRSIIATLIALTSLTMIGRAMTSGWIPQPEISALANSLRFGAWINANIVFFMLALISVSAILLLVSQSQSVLSRKERFSQELAAERNKLRADFEEQKQTLSRRAGEMEAASLLARDISKFTDLDLLFTNAVNLIKNQFGFYHAGLFLVDEKKEFAVLRAATGEAGRQMLSQEHRLRVGEVGLVGYTVSRGEVRISQNVGTDTVHYKNPLLPETNSELALPLIASGEVIGALDIQSTKEMAFSHEDVKILQLIADQLAVAINKAQILQKLQKTVDELELRYSETAHNAWKQYFGATEQGVSLSFAQDHFNASAPLLAEVKQAIKDKKSIVASKTLEDERKLTSLAIPLKLRENVVLGALQIGFEGDSVSPQVVEMLENISNRLALALDRARLLQEIRVSAEQERLVSDVTAKLRASANIDNILKTAAAEIGRSLGAAEVIVQLLPANDE